MTRTVDLTESWRRFTLPETGHYVYILRDQDGLVLYIGQSSNVCRRVYQHEQRWWYQLVQTIEIEHCADRTAALRLERELIQTLNPVANIAGHPLKKAS